MTIKLIVLVVILILVFLGLAMHFILDYRQEKSLLLHTFRRDVENLKGRLRSLLKTKKKTSVIFCYFNKACTMHYYESKFSFGPIKRLLEDFNEIVQQYNALSSPEEELPKKTGLLRVKKKLCFLERGKLD